MLNVSERRCFEVITPESLIAVDPLGGKLTFCLPWDSFYFTRVGAFLNFQIQLRMTFPSIFE